MDFPLLLGAESGEVPLRRVAVVRRWLAPPCDGARGSDLAGLALTDGPAPDGAIPARLAASEPPTDTAVRVFGYPQTPPRPEGVWVPTIIRGRVGGGLFQLDSSPGSAVNVQQGFSGSPVCDSETGAIIGLVALAGQRTAVVGTATPSPTTRYASCGQRSWTRVQRTSQPGLAMSAPSSQPWCLRTGRRSRRSASAPECSLDGRRSWPRSRRLRLGMRGIGGWLGKRGRGRQRCSPRQWRRCRRK